MYFDASKPFSIWTDNLQLAFSKIKARLQWGSKHAKDVERWGEGIRVQLVETNVEQGYIDFKKVNASKHG